jgi:hypothetical protein
MWFQAAATNDVIDEASEFALDCNAYGMEVHWVQGITMADAGHWGNARPAPYGEPVIWLVERPRAQTPTELDLVRQGGGGHVCSEPMREVRMREGALATSFRT